MGTTAANFSYFNLELDAGVTYLSKLRPIGALNRSRQLEIRRKNINSFLTRRCRRGRRRRRCLSFLILNEHKRARLRSDIRFVQPIDPAC